MCLLPNLDCLEGFFSCRTPQTTGADQVKADRDQEDKDRRREMSQMRAEAYKHIKLQRQLEEVSQKEALENAKIQYEMGAHVS